MTRRNAPAAARSEGSRNAALQLITASEPARAAPVERQRAGADRDRAAQAVPNSRSTSTSRGCSTNWASPADHGVVLVHASHGLVLVVWIASAAFAAVDPSMEEAARNLGSSPLDTFRTMTLPLAAPGLMASAIFVFLESVDEFTGTYFVRVPDVTTLPLPMFNASMGGNYQIASITALLLLVPRSGSCSSSSASSSPTCSRWSGAEAPHLASVGGYTKPGSSQLGPCSRQPHGSAAHNRPTKQTRIPSLMARSPLKSVGTLLVCSSL